MEEMYKELEEVRSSVEALKEECRAKTVLCESLRRAHDEQVVRLQEARVEIRKQAEVIDAKEEEISAAQQKCEELRSGVCEKESALKHLRSANESLRASYSEKIIELEGEKKHLVSILDEANAKEEEQNRVVSSCKQEIERLKGLLSIAQKKCMEAEEKAQSSRELKRRDEVVARLERDKGEVEEQLKWRSEQFKHLEEAHERLQGRYQASKKEWEVERASLVDEVSSLQNSLDSETRVAEDLRSQLQMCNQALAHEEGRRKLLEVQMSESRALYENVMSEYEEARSNIRSLTSERDEVIAELRNSLSAKTTLAKELDFKATRLEQENEELRSALKELREAQINGAGAASSFKSLQLKFRALEQAHKACSKRLKAREAEGSAKKEELSNEVDDCLLKLSNKEKQLQYLQSGLQVSDSSLMQVKLENEELNVVLMILRSKFLDACSSFEELKHESEQYNLKTEQRIHFLMQQLEKKNCDLVQAEAEIKRERETVSQLLSKVEASESIQKEYGLMQKDISSYKTVLEESWNNIEQLKEEASRRENDLLQDVKTTLASLDQANSVIDDNSNLISKLGFELQQSKMVAEHMQRMRCDLELQLGKCRDENLLIARDLETSLLAKIEIEKELNEVKETFLHTMKEKDKEIETLQVQVALLEKDKQTLEASFLHKSESEKISDKEKKFLPSVEDLYTALSTVQEGVDSLEQNYLLREIETSMKLAEETEMFEQVLEEKERVVDEMQEKIVSYEEEFRKSIANAVSMKAVQSHVCRLGQALEEAMSRHILDKHEIHYRNNLVAELGEDIYALQRKAEFGEKLAFNLQNRLQELEANLLTIMSEKEKERVQFENDLNNLLSIKTTLEFQKEMLESEKNSLYGSLEWLASDRDELVNQLMGFTKLIANIYDKGEEVKRNMDRVLQTATIENTTDTATEVQDLFNSTELERKKLNSSPKSIVGQVLDRRSPLKENNC